MNLNVWKSIAILLPVAAVCPGLTPALSACPVRGNVASFNASIMLSSRAVRAQAISRLAAEKAESDNSKLEITGLWELTQTVDGQLFDHALQQLFADGNEVQNSAVVPPAAGNICFGVWERTGNRTFRMKHYGWNFDAQGNFTSTFYLEATMTMTDGDNYTGTFVTDTILPNGTKDPNLHAEGTIAAKRIKLN